MPQNHPLDSPKTLFFFPQLYELDADERLVALEGDEIGKLLARAVQDGVVEKQPWYEPSEKLPSKPITTTTMQTDFDTVVVDGTTTRPIS